MVSFNLRHLLIRFRSSFHGPFRALSITLLLVSTIPLLTGTLQAIYGPYFAHMLSSNLAEVCMHESTLVSQYRFMGSMWWAYATFMWIIILNPVKYQAIMHVICLHAVIGGCFRLHTALLEGFPQAPLAKFVIMAAVLLEFTIPYLMQRFLYRGLDWIDANRHKVDTFGIQ